MKFSPYRFNDSQVSIVPVIDVMKFAEKSGELPQELMLVPIGTWNTMKYGQIQVTQADLFEMKLNFERGVRKGVMIDIEHGESEYYKDAAAGWIEQLEVKEDGLYATKIQWNKLARELISEGIYRFLSPEFSQIYTDPENTEQVYRNVLIACSLVNRPLFKELPGVNPLTASEGDITNLTDQKTSVILLSEPMELAKILQKTKETLTADEKAFLLEHKEDLTLKQIKAFDLEAPVAPTKETPAAPVTAKEGEVVLKASEVEELKAKAAAADETIKAAEKVKVEQEVEGMLFSEKGGKIPPGAKDTAIEFMMSLNADQRLKFSEFMKKIPETGSKYFDENGSPKDMNVTPKNEEGKIVAGSELDARAKEIVTASEGKKSYREAVNEAIAENPQLANYNADINSTT